MEKEVFLGVQSILCFGLDFWVCSDAKSADTERSSGDL